MRLSWSPGTVVLFVLIASIALYLAWRTAGSVLRAKAGDPDQLRKRLFIPLLILIIIIALIQLMTVFFRK